MMMHHRLVYRAVTMSMTKIRRRGGEKTEGVHEEQRLPPRPPYCYHHRRNEMPPPAYYYVAAVAHGVSFSRQRGYLVIRPGETIDLTPNLPYNTSSHTHTPDRRLFPGCSPYKCTFYRHLLHHLHVCANVPDYFEWQVRRFKPKSPAPRRAARGPPPKLTQRTTRSLLSPTECSATSIPLPST